jgi:transcription elongation factor GreA
LTLFDKLLLCRQFVIKNIAVNYFVMRLPNRKPGKYTNIKLDPLMTEDKLTQLKDKLERLKNVSRPRAIVDMRAMAELGDFSENAGYHAAKARLRGINRHILILEEQVKQAVIIPTQQQTDTVQVGHRVTLETGRRQVTYHILGSSETDPSRGRISRTSPLGAALLGHRAGETVRIKLENGRLVEYVIVGIR